MLNLLELIGSYPKESGFKKRMRLHQGWWRAFVIGEKQGKHPLKKDKYICNTIPNGEKTKKNLLSNFVQNVVNEVLRERDAGSAGIIAQDRLYNNLLSSQPLCFNFFAPMYNDKKHALNFLQKFYPKITKVNAVYFEYSNSRKYDNSAFDIAFDVFVGSRKGIIGFECKYTDSFSPTSHNKPVYESIFRQSNIWCKSYEELTSSRYNQLFRNQLIAESLKQEEQYDFGYSALFCHHHDDKAIKIAEEYKGMLIDEQSDLFQIITYKAFFENVMKLDLTWQIREYYMQLWARYCGIILSDSAYEQLKEVEHGNYQVYDINEMEFQNKKKVAVFEGGVIYSAEKGDELFTIVDESTLTDLLDNQDKNEIGCLHTIYKFVNESNRKFFIDNYKTIKGRKIVET